MAQEKYPLIKGDNASVSATPGEFTKNVILTMQREGFYGNMHLSLEAAEQLALQLAAAAKEIRDREVNEQKKVA